MGDNQNSLNRFPLKAFVLIHFATVFVMSFTLVEILAQISQVFSALLVNTILIMEAVFIVLVY